MPSPISAVNLTQHFAARPEVIFDAWTNPAVMRRWLFKSPANEIRNIKVHLCIGGPFSILEWTGTEEIDHFGHYLEIDRPHRLAFTLEVPKHFPGVTKITLDITSTPNGSQMQFTQAGVKPEIVEKNWIEMFSSLATVIGHRA